ncbi:hypothetical protein MVES_001270 [Malassezia vespertilionis]|uniref:Uncharacterized protein n=1 Tax=Malassezia vespertilionis TaxID=2020962 RepID=A0A2N1JE87_9BASI|nr:hypothetical protein MVES_001270 [Malassezia vespertilionis]
MDSATWVPSLDLHLWREGRTAASELLLDSGVYTACAGAAGWICDSTEGWGPMSPVRDFDLTPCFQAVMLWIIPCLGFVLYGLHALQVLKHMPVLQRSDSSLHLLHEKDGIAVVITILSVCQVPVMLGLRSHLQGSALMLVSNLQVVASLVETVAYACALLLQHASHLRARHSCDAVVLFWLLQMITGPIQVRTMIQLAPKNTAVQLGLIVPFFLRLVLIAFDLVMECNGIEGGEREIALQEGDEDVMYVDSEEPVEVDEPAASYNDMGESPLVNASLFSRLSFSWMQPMMSLGSKRSLLETDMWALPANDDTESLGDKFQQNWARQTERITERGEPLHNTQRRRFWNTLLASYGTPFLVAAVYKLVQDSLAFVQPQILKSLLAFVQNWERHRDDPAQHGTVLRGYVLAMLLFLTSLIQMVCLHQYFQLVSVAGMRARAGVVSSIFRKSLRLSNEARGKSASGDIVNLMSVDANRLPDFIMYAHITWSGVFQITIAFISLYRLLGWTAFVGVAIMAVSLPFNAVLATYLRSLSADQMKVKDRRTQIMNEIIINIKSIKLFSWESAFYERMASVRNGEELPLLRRIGIASAGFNFFWQAIPFFVSLGTFVAFSFTSDTPLTADIVFPALSLYQLLNFPMSMLAGVFSMFLQTQISATRLGDFFDAEELDPNARVHISIPDASERPPTASHVPDHAVSLHQASFRWTHDQPSATLKELTIAFKRGELTAVLGRVGAGKSSLLAAILGEMIRDGGKETVYGEISYFSQGGWCMGATVRDNILFEREYDEALYKRVLYACALEPDIALLPDGDRTEIGERGVSLSGGQRARVALARACYAAADIYLLDDPLAAVDAHVGAHIWKHVIGPTGILQGRTRILTTNAVSFLSACDHIVTLRDGALLPERGSFAEIMAMRGDVYKLITGLGRQGDKERSGSATPIESAEAETVPLRRPRELSKAEIKLDTLRQLRESSVPKENKATGSVSWAVYKDYIKSAGVSGVVLFFVAQGATQMFSLSRDIVLKQWSAANERHGDVPDPHITHVYLSLYTLVGFFSSLGYCVAPFILYTILAINTAKFFHDGLFHAVMHYPLQWFETTPTGRLLNLFSRDVSVVDEVLPRVIQGMVRSSFVVVSVVFLVLLLPLVMLYRAVMIYYLASSRELKRLDAISKSPVFTWFQESLNGLSTIRAYAQTNAFTDSFEARVDRNQMCYLPAFTCNRWLAIRIEFLGSIVIFFASTMAVRMVTTSGRMSAGLMGLMLSQALSTTQALNWAVRSISEVEQNVVSVERIISYMHLPEEAPYQLPDTAPPPPWPKHGTIEFCEYATRYRPDLPLVLNKLSFTINAGERVGVVGRTGAGKSTLTLALFRIVESVQGSIMIDGVDIASMGLHDLRKSMAIIPQDPQLWQGTLRQNLDPMEHYSDAALQEALVESRLQGLLTDPLGLDQPVTESGSNFSSGQRQLICIARALVRHSKILVLDEATSSIDLETDELVQTLVREKFKGTTITIAHRLNTILDSDRVLVLKDGSLCEYDTPANLLRDPQSQFYSMAIEAGLADAMEEGRSNDKAGIEMIDANANADTTNKLR